MTLHSLHCMTPPYRPPNLEATHSPSAAGGPSRQPTEATSLHTQASATLQHQFRCTSVIRHTSDASFRCVSREGRLIQTHIKHFKTDLCAECGLNSTVMQSDCNEAMPQKSINITLTHVAEVSQTQVSLLGLDDKSVSVVPPVRGKEKRQEGCGSRRTATSFLSFFLAPTVSSST